jgi:putative transposase
MGINLEEDIWHWYHNISECHYHIQLTVKYRKSLLTPGVQQVFLEALKQFKDRFAIEICLVGFDQNHLHILCRFLPKYSGGQVIRLIKCISAREIFGKIPSVKKDLWGGEFFTDGYYIGTISGKGNKKVIEDYIRNQGRSKDLDQLKLFEL